MFENSHTKERISEMQFLLQRYRHLLSLGLHGAEHFEDHCKGLLPNDIEMGNPCHSINFKIIKL